MNTLAGVLLGLVFIVESGVWYVRSMATPEYRSKSIATSNIVMYATRVLIAGYQIILNFRIESGEGLKEVLHVTLIGMLVAFFGHILFFYNNKLRTFSWNLFVAVFGKFNILTSGEYENVPFAPAKSIRALRGKVLIASAFSTIALVLVYIAPQMFATFYPSYRLTLSSVGQAISFFGMVITLFVLDPVLFKMHDDGRIQTGFAMYLMGRLLGLILASLLLALTIIAFSL